MIFQSKKKKVKDKKSGWIDFGKLKKFQRDMQSHYKRWEENTKLYEGQHWDVISSKFSELSTLDKVTVNYPFSAIFTMLPTLYYRNPYVFATPQVGMDIPDVVEKINIATAILNIELQDINKKRMMKEAIQFAILDSLVCDFGMVKVGYLAKKKRKTGDKTADVNNASVDEDSFFVDRINPMDVVFDTSIKNIRAMRWILVRYKKHFRDLENDKSIDKEALQKIVTDYQKSTGDDTSKPEYVYIYEYWDKDKDMFAWIHLDSETVLKEQKSPYNFFPYIPLVMYIARSKGTGLSLIELMKSLIIELDIFRSKHITVSRKAANIFQAPMVGRGVEKLKQDLRSAKDMDVIPVPNGGEIRPIQYAGHTIDIEVVSRIIKQDLQETGAIPDFEMGVTSKTKSATEASIMANVSSIRKGYLRDRVADFVKEIVNAISWIIRKFYIRRRTTYLKLDNVVTKLDWSGLDVPEGFNFDIDVDSMQFSDIVTQRRNLTELMTILMSNPVFVEMIKEDIPNMINELVRLYGFEYLGVKAKTYEELRQEQEEEQQRQLQMQQQIVQANPQLLAQYNQQLQRRLQQPLTK